MRRPGSIAGILAQRAWLAALSATVVLQAGNGDRIVVERAELPVLLAPLQGNDASRSVCQDPDPAAIEVEIDGLPARVRGVEPHPQTRLHALLIDTSESMATRLDALKRAARAYLAAVPADEPVLVATFDESVVLAAAPTLDRRALGQAIDGLEIGYRTALWESLRDLLRYLGELQGETVLVLLTDGADSVGTGPEALREVERIVLHAPELVLFVLGIELPWTAGADRARLHRLARDTGGDVFEIRGTLRPTDVGDTVQRRLAERRYLFYEPPALAPRVGPREVRVRGRPGLPCRVRLLGAPVRSLGSGPERPAIEPLHDAPSLVAPDCGIANPARRVGALRSADAVQTFVRLAPPTTALVELLDVVLEPGPRFREGALLDPPRLSTAAAGRRSVERRTVVVDLPPLDRLRASRRDAVEVLRALLLDERFCLSAASRPAFVVSGRTFLEARELLGRGLFEAREDYRLWANARATAQEVERLRGLLDSTRDSRALSATAVEAALHAASERATDPLDGRPQVRLAEWLSDARASAAARELERRLAGELLDGALDQARRASVAWPRLAQVLPPAVQGRIVVPLLPAYDPARDAIGFHRFLLAAPRPDGAPPALVSRRALGLELLLWLDARAELRPLLTPGARVEAIDYAPLRGSAFGRADCARGAGAVEHVVVRLAGGSSSAPLVLRACFAAGSAVPACVAVGSAEPSAPQGTHPLGQPVERSAARSISSSILRAAE